MRNLPDNFEEPWPKLAFAGYLLLLIAFGSSELLKTRILHEERIPLRSWFLLAATGLSFCVAVGFYEFCLVPDFRHYYKLMLPGAMLPQSTRALLFIIPRGMLTLMTLIVFALSSSAKRWRVGSRNLRKSASLLFLAFGIALLVFVPYALLEPFLHI